jgi:hypothetical protein
VVHADTTPANVHEAMRTALIHGFCQGSRHCSGQRGLVWL